MTSAPLSRSVLAVLVLAIAAVPLLIGCSAVQLALGPASTTEAPAAASEPPPRKAHVGTRESRSTPRAPTPLKRLDVTPAGSAQACPANRAFPESASSVRIVKQVATVWGVQLEGRSWTTSANRRVLRAMWHTLDGVDCTGYLSTIKAKNDGRLIISGQKRGSWAWGDWGYSRPHAVSLNLTKMARAIDDGQAPRVTRVMVHELAHAWSVDRDRGGYYSRFERVTAGTGGVTEYGSQSSSENFAEAVGYYVARCAVEQSDTGRTKPNPYDDPSNAKLYAYVKKTVFDGREFGPGPGRSC